MGLFRRRREPAEQLPPNEEFSVVSGVMVLADGRQVGWSAVVPTVFGGGAFPGDSGGGIAVEETVEFAEMAAHDAHGSCRWADRRAVELRPATADEQAWALANGVNERFGG